MDFPFPQEKTYSPIPDGEQIRRARQARNMTQRQLSRLAYCSLSLVRKIEQGSRPISPDMERVFGEVLGIRQLRAG
jgi:transcriptional regulator with XRE-family HTH domain